MDRTLHGPSPIPVAISEETLAALNELGPAGGFSKAMIFEQLDTGVWIYDAGDYLRLVTRYFSAELRFEHDTALHARLTLSGPAPTDSREVTIAFRDGYRLTAQWVPAEEHGDHTGALWLWSQLKGDGQGGAGEEAASFETDDGGVAQTLLQNEIDKLVGSMMGDAPRQEDLNNGLELPPEAGSPEAKIYSDSASWEGEPALDGSRNSTLVTGINLDEWINPAGPVQEEVQDNPRDTESDAGAGRDESEIIWGLASRGSYTVWAFSRREIFEHDLAIMRAQKDESTLLALWRGKTVYQSYGPLLKRRLDTLKKKNAAAAAVESKASEDPGSGSERPGVERYEPLMAESKQLDERIRQMSLQEVLHLPEGRLLAARTFALEARAHSLSRALGRYSYSVLNSRRGSIRRRLMFRRTRRRWLGNKKRIESCYKRLAGLEDTVKRRIEYRGDWRDMMNRRIKIDQELNELIISLETAGRNHKGGSPEEWEEAAERRKRLQRKWQERLDDGHVWQIRDPREPLVLMGDASILSLPRATTGAVLMLFELERDESVEEALDECAAWSEFDSSHNEFDSGEGKAPVEADPLSDLIAEMGEEEGIELKEALNILGLDNYAFARSE